ncbi:MAG: hypothetical protein ACREDI_03325 [Roseiarcus sp.]
MQRIILAIDIACASVSLCGCNLSSRPYEAAPVAAAPPAGAAPNWPPLPQNASCTEKLNSYQKVLTADVKTGNVARSVYDAIEGDLMRAADACAAGKDGEALSIIRATQVKHGYHV